MLIAQITDCHVTAKGTLALGAIDTNTALARAVAFLNRLDPRPDLVLLTGDLINGPKPGEYEAAAEILAGLSLPLRLIPGNHDDRAGLRAAFPSAFPAGGPAAAPAGDGFLHQALDLGPLRLLALDSTIPGRVEGILCPARLDWIAARLAEDDRPTLVALHHPPFPTGIGFMDAIGCANGDRLEALLRHHGAIVGVLTGHVHRAIAQSFAGSVGFCCPSSAFQMAFQPDPDAPARWTREPPALALHQWQPGQPLRSHVVPIGDFPPTPFG